MATSYLASQKVQQPDNVCRNTRIVWNWSQLLVSRPFLLSQRRFFLMSIRLLQREPLTFLVGYRLDDVSGPGSPRWSRYCFRTQNKPTAARRNRTSSTNRCSDGKKEVLSGLVRRKRCGNGTSSADCGAGWDDVWSVQLHHVVDRSDDHQLIDMLEYSWWFSYGWYFVGSCGLDDQERVMLSADLGLGKADERPLGWS